MPLKYNINLFTFFQFVFLLKLFSISCNEFQKEIIVIPFKSFYPNINENDQSVKYIGSMIKRKMYWESENEKGQKIPVIMVLRLSTMHTSDSVGLLYTDEEIEYYYKPNSNDICKFNYKDSNNYKCTTPYNKSFFLKGKSCFAKEKFKFYTDIKLSKENIKLYDIEFIHTVNKTEICFFDGLQWTSDSNSKERNFLYQLKNNINSKYYSWMLKFNSPDEGYFIFGDIINNNNIDFIKDINIDDNYESIYVQPFSSGTIFWKISFDYLFLGKNVTADNIQVFIDINSQFIRIPDKIFSNIKKVYFSNYFYYNYKDGHPICFDKYVFAKFKGIYCNKKEFLKETNNYKNLPDLNFYSSDLHFNITFTAIDLFRDFNNTLFFLIGHDTQIEKDEWYFGTILLEKYTIIFDSESKQLRFLKFNKTNKINNNSYNKNNIYIAVIITLLLSGIFFSFIGLRYGKRIYQSRKIKANELNDGYDYSSYKEINNKNKLGINYSNDINLKNDEKGINEYSLEMTKTQ